MSNARNTTKIVSRRVGWFEACLVQVDGTPKAIKCSGQGPYPEVTRLWGKGILREVYPVGGDIMPQDPCETSCEFNLVGQVSVLVPTPRAVCADAGGVYTWRSKAVAMDKIVTFPGGNTFRSMEYDFTRVGEAAGERFCVSVPTRRDLTLATLDLMGRFSDMQGYYMAKKKYAKRREAAKRLKTWPKGLRPPKVPSFGKGGMQKVVKTAHKHMVKRLQTEELLADHRAILSALHWRANLSSASAKLKLLYATVQKGFTSIVMERFTPPDVVKVDPEALSELMERVRTDPYAFAFNPSALYVPKLPPANKGSSQSKDGGKDAQQALDVFRLDERTLSDVEDEPTGAGGEEGPESDMAEVAEAGREGSSATAAEQRREWEELAREAGVMPTRRKWITTVPPPTSQYRSMPWKTGNSAIRTKLPPLTAEHFTVEEMQVPGVALAMQIVKAIANRETGRDNGGHTLHAWSQLMSNFPNETVQNQRAAWDILETRYGFMRCLGTIAHKAPGVSKDMVAKHNRFVIGWESAEMLLRLRAAVGWEDESPCGFPDEVNRLRRGTASRPYAGAGAGAGAGADACVPWPFLDVDTTEDLVKVTAEAQNIPMDDVQRAAAVKVLIIPGVHVVTGPAGSGKTSSVLRAVVETAGKGCAVVVARTAAAARVAGSAIRHVGAHTMHKVIHSFALQKLIPYLSKVRWAIIDEASMVSTSLLRAFLKKLLFHPATHLRGIVLVGDVNQIPPIEAGDVLGTMVDPCVVDSGMVTVSRLTKVYRASAQGIVKTSNDILGKRQLRSYADSGVWLAPIRKDDRDMCIDIYNIVKNLTTKAPTPVAYNPEHVRVLAYNHRHVNILNSMLRAMHHGLLGTKRGAELSASKVMVGDFVRFTENVDTMGEGAMKVYNHLCGTIERLEWVHPDGSTDNIPRGQEVVPAAHEVTGFNFRMTLRPDASMLKQFGRKPRGEKDWFKVEWTLDRAVTPRHSILVHAYAGTAHSAQGKEFHTVVAVLQYYIERKVLYTMATRATNRLVIATKENGWKTLRDPAPRQTVLSLAMKHLFASGFLTLPRGEEGESESDSDSDTGSDSDSDSGSDADANAGAGTGANTDGMPFECKTPTPPRGAKRARTVEELDVERRDQRAEKLQRAQEDMTTRVRSAAAARRVIAFDSSDDDDDSEE